MDTTFNARNLTRTFEITIGEDSDPNPDEFIVLALADDASTMATRVADDFSLGGPLTITIPANDNIVGFASSTSTLGEMGTSSVEVGVGSNLLSPITEREQTVHEIQWLIESFGHLWQLT